MVKITLGVIVYRKYWCPFQITQGQNLILKLGAYYLEILFVRVLMIIVLGPPLNITS